MSLTGKQAASFCLCRKIGHIKSEGTTQENISSGCPQTKHALLQQQDVEGEEQELVKWKQIFAGEVQVLL